MRAYNKPNKSITSNNNSHNLEENCLQCCLAMWLSGWLAGWWGWSVCGALADHVTKVDNGDYFICLAYCRSSDGTGIRHTDSSSSSSSKGRVTQACGVDCGAGMYVCLLLLLLQQAAAFCPVAPHDTWVMATQANLWQVTFLMCSFIKGHRQAQRLCSWELRISIFSLSLSLFLSLTRDKPGFPHDAGQHPVWVNYKRRA